MDIVVYIVATLAVLALAYAALHLIRRFPGQAPDAELRFVSALPVGQRERLVVVMWAGKRLLLGVSAGAVTLIDEAPAPAASETAPTPSPHVLQLADYGAVLGRVRAKVRDLQVGRQGGEAGRQRRRPNAI
jgi:flagellar protein FliO/FliZ